MTLLRGKYFQCARFATNVGKIFLKYLQSYLRFYKSFSIIDCLAKYTVTSFSGGIRCGELGGVMHGKDTQNLEDDNEFEDENGELLRLAIPRRTYTESHMK